MLIPTVIEQTARGERAFDIYSQLLGQRIVFLGRPIDADVANMSLGGGFYKMGNGRFVGLINKTFNYAHQQGTLVVVAAATWSSVWPKQAATVRRTCTRWAGSLRRLLGRGRMVRGSK